MSNKELKVGGTKVTLKPSEQIVRESVKEVNVTDEGGRVITCKKPNPLANLDFAKAAGGDTYNVLYLSEVAHLKFVSAIDGDPVPTPSTDGELRALYVRLGDYGNEAARKGAIAIANDSLEGIEELKNS